MDEELEYLVYWVDITRFVQDRWGVIQDGLLNDYTRLFDFNSSKVCLSPPSPLPSLALMFTINQVFSIIY